MYPLLEKIYVFKLFIRVGSILLFGLMWLFTPYYCWKANKKRVVIQIPPSNPILRLSATGLAQKIREKQITSFEVVSAYISRCKEINGIINAVVQERYLEALQEAKDVDNYIRQSEISAEMLEKTKPLLGVPLTIKESCKVKGMSYAVGCLKRKGIRADENSEVINKLKDAGGIILLVSNAPELCFSLETSNYITGVTKNPYDTRRSVGGSSGGEAALVASGSSVIGIGSDGGGSIRIPAALCGVFGHKPTPHLVPITGHYPPCHEKIISNYAVMGHLVRYAEDLPLVMKVLAGEKAFKMKLNEKVELKTIKVYFHEGIEEPMVLIMPPVEMEIKDKLRQAVKFLKYKHGCQIESANLDFKGCVEAFLTKLNTAENVPNVLENEGVKKKDNLWIEILKNIFGLSIYTPYLLYFYMTKFFSTLQSENENSYYLKHAEKFKEHLLSILGENDVLLFPTFPTPAFYHDMSLATVLGNIYCILANICGVPSTNVPLGLNSSGLPISIQVIAAPNQDRLCFAVAKELEKGFGGWVPPQY